MSDDISKDDDMSKDAESHSDDSNADDMHFSDEELEAALAGFEQEFQDADNETTADNSGNSSHDDTSADTALADKQTDISSQFEDELAGLLGNKAKAAVIITRIASAQLLAAFCQLSDISADCIGSPEGAIAVLSHLDGDSPEAAARDITTVVSGMSVILAVNRADKLEATLYLQGKPTQTFAPPILFSATPSFVEDLMLGISDLNALHQQGIESMSSSELSHDDAMHILADHTKFGRNGSSIE